MWSLYFEKLNGKLTCLTLSLWHTGGLSHVILFKVHLGIEEEDSWETELIFKLLVDCFRWNLKQLLDTPVVHCSLEPAGFCSRVYCSPSLHALCYILGFRTAGFWLLTLISGQMSSEEQQLHPNIWPHSPKISHFVSFVWECHISCQRSEGVDL